MPARQGDSTTRDWFEKAIAIEPNAGAINNLGVLYGERRQGQSHRDVRSGIRAVGNDETLI
jgi:hypothetical protein